MQTVVRNGSEADTASGELAHIDTQVRAPPRVVEVKTKRWLRRQGLEVPMMVALETTNKCNAFCWFCPITDGSTRPPDDPDALIQLAASKPARPETDDCDSFKKMQRPLGYMSDDLFEKIIEDCREFPLRRIEPYLHGEPFMDPKMCDRIEHINRRIPKTEVHIFTNGSLLTHKTVERLRDLRVGSLLISLNTPTPEKYNAIMGLSWKKTLANLERVAAAQKSRKPIADRFILRMTAPKETTDDEISRFKKLARSLGARPVIVSLHNYKGGIETERPVPRFPCYFVRDLDILWSGQTALCCMDHDGDYSWGDVTKHSVLEVFNSEQARHYRTMMRSDRRGELDPCGDCNMFWWSMGGTGANRIKFTARLASYLIKYRPLKFDIRSWLRL